MGLHANIKREQIDTLRLREAIVVSTNTTVRDAVQRMRQNDIGCVIVVDGERKPIGIFTESMLTEMLSHHADSLGESIEKHMAKRCPWVRNTDPISELLESLELKNIRMLCVVDEADRVVGITGQRGLMEYVADHFPGQVMVQRIGLSPYLSDREGA